MSLAEHLKGKGLKDTPRPKAGPVWKGPEVDGITFSLLCKFLNDRERFRILTVEGLKPQDRFDHKMEFGNMWHVCEETLARYPGIKGVENNKSVRECLQNYCQQLCRKYPYQQEEIDRWYRTIKVQFPEYVKHWSRHPDIVGRTPLLQEQTFDVPYKLPSGRVVRLRGKWDSVDLVKGGPNAGIWLQENKTKGDIEEDKIYRQMYFDLQTMLYLVALEEAGKQIGRPLFKGVPDLTHPLRGVRYNVVRRPFSGGEGMIVQKKGSKNIPAETTDQFYERLRTIFDGTGINSKGEPYTGPTHWFMRWNVEISAADIERFKKEFLDPCLEFLCVWWDSVDPSRFIPTVEISPSILHWRHPFGVRNYLDDGGSSDLDEYLKTGSTAGLQRVDNLFPELT